MNMLAVSQEGGVTVIAPTARRLDASVAPAFKQAAVQVIEGGATRVVLDLDNLDFVDSSGLGAMVSILKALGSRGSIAVCNVKGSVLSLFTLTRMDKVFAVCSSRAEAVARLGG